MSGPFVLFDSTGRRWRILHTAERSYVRVMRAIHPDITSEHAREEWRELVEEVHYLRQALVPPLEVWRAAGAFDRVYLVIEQVKGGLRVCEVLPAHDASARPTAPTAPPVAKRTPASSAAISSRPTSSSSRAPRVVRSAQPAATPPPERPVPVVDPGVLLLVGAELAGAPYRAASEIAARQRLPVAEVRNALAVLQPYAQEAPARHHREVADVEVLTARRRPGR
jgi:hypothetical protein